MYGGKEALFMEYDWTGARTRRANHFKLGLLCLAAMTMMAVPLWIGLV